MTHARDSAPIVRREVAGNGFRVREITYPPWMRQPPHAHDRAGVTLVLGGGIREMVGTTEEVARILSVVIKPAGVVHADQVGPHGAFTLQVLVDPDLERSTTDRGVGRWRWFHGGPGARGLLALCRWLRGVRAPRAVLEDEVLQVLADVADMDETLRVDPPRWLERAREALEDMLPEGIRVRELADLCGVHPVSLARAFRRHYGVSVTEYRRRERVRRATLAIEKTDRDLTRIACQAGFSDHPHMCREIRAATGLTPGQLRSLVRQARV